MRAVGGNPEGAGRVGIGSGGYIIVGMFVAGGLDGLVGMAQVSTVEWRLRHGLSPGCGVAGFLISWLAGGSPLGIVLMAFVFSMISTGGDILQITQGLPFAAVNILLALILFVVLARPTSQGRRSS